MNNDLTNFNDDDRVIRGSILRCVDGKWSDTSGAPPPEQLLAMGTTECLQCWSGGKPVDVVRKVDGEPLPDVDELNQKIPTEEWETGLDGKPRAPWCKQYVAYFVDPATAENFTFINGTAGARIAVGRLADRVATMRRLRGIDALPIVKLGSRPMKTKFGTKQRPEFEIASWHVPANQPAVKAIEHQPTIGPDVIKRIADPTPSEELNDALPPGLAPPWTDNPLAAG